MRRVSDGQRSACRCNRPMETKPMKKALAAGLAWVLMSLAQAQTPIVIKFSHVVAEGTPKGRAAA